MISWAMNSHMPRDVASFWSPMFSKWWASFGWCEAMACSDNLDLLPGGVVVRLFAHDRLRREVEGGRRRLRLPLEPLRLPRVVGGGLAVEERPGEVDGG